MLTLSFISEISSECNLIFFRKKIHLVPKEKVVTFGINEWLFSDVIIGIYISFALYGGKKKGTFFFTTVAL